MALFCSLQAFSADDQGEYGNALLSNPRAESSCPLLFLEPSQNSNQCLISLVSIRTLHSPCLCLIFFISDVWPSFKTPNFRDSHHADPHCSFQEGSRHTSAICWTIPGKQSRGCTVDRSLWQHRAESQYLDLPLSASFHTLMPRNSAALRCHLFFLQPRGSSDIGVTLEFCPASPPEHL